MATEDRWLDNWELAFPSEYIRAADLQGRDVTLTIGRVTYVELEMARQSASGKIQRQKERRLVLHFTELANRGPGEPTKLLPNKTNCRTIETLYGRAPRDWSGKRVTLFAEEVDAWGKRKEAVRIRPTRPPARSTQERSQRARDPSPPSPTSPAGDAPLSAAGEAPLSEEEKREILRREAEEQR